MGDRFVRMMPSIASLLLCLYIAPSASFTATPFRGYVVMPRPQHKLGVQRLTMKDENVVRVGIIGAGRIGLVHLEALASCLDAKPIIISNPTVSKAEKAAEQYNVPHFTGDAMEVINHPEVDAVWICSPSQFHADQIKACAAVGKHVF